MRIVYPPCMHHPLDPSFVPFDSDPRESIPSRFVRVAVLHGCANAVQSHESKLTYTDLAREGGRVASAILNAMREDRSPIALLIGHNSAALATIVGILLAGRAYVPLDPLYPPDRLRYMVVDSMAGAIITDSSNLELAFSLAQEAGTGTLINLDSLEVRHFNFARARAPSPLSPVYVLYTSGSTGHPKGVAQSHRNVLFQVGSQTNNLRICPRDRLSLLTSLSFDASVTDLFGALLNGATSVLIDARRHGLSAARMQLRDEGVTIYHSTPTLFRHLFADLRPNELFPSIRAVVLGGEKVTKREVDLFRRHFRDDCVLVNGYGATEASFALQHHMTKRDIPDEDVLSVGWPINGVDIILLDESGRETPIEGEIGIRSQYVAPGYWNRPDLTAAHFQLAVTDGDPMTYRTGDMGRRLADGRYVCLGRKDNQVKIRGNRVELSEVEIKLRKAANGAEVAVVARDDAADPGNMRIVAFIVRADGTRTDSLHLRRKLADLVPEYMIPSAFLFLDELPLTATGKIDSQTLRVIAAQRSRSNSPRAISLSSLEQHIFDSWTGALGSEVDSAEVTFFEAGGNSLAMLRVHQLLQDRLHIDIPLFRLFQFPTVRGLAQFIGHQSPVLDARPLRGAVAEPDAG